MEKIKKFFLDVQKEMKKVSWPSQKELVDYTVVVVIFTVILALFIFGVDQVYTVVLETIYQ